MPHFRCSLMSMALVLSLGGRAPGQDDARKVKAGPETSQDADGDVRTARVVIDGEPLFFVRGVTARPADRRAGEIADRIRALAENQKFDAKSLTLEEHPGATWILAGGVRIMALFDDDAALEQTSRHTLAELYRVRIGEAIEAYRRDRRPALLWLRSLYALVATVLLLVAAIVGRRIVRLLRSLLEGRFSAHIHGLEDRAFHIVKSNQIWRAFSALVNIAWGLVSAVAAYAYLNYVLALFPWTRALARNLFASALDPLRRWVWDSLKSFPTWRFSRFFSW